MMERVRMSRRMYLSARKGKIKRKIQHITPYTINQTSFINVIHHFLSFHNIQMPISNSSHGNGEKQNKISMEF